MYYQESTDKKPKFVPVATIKSGDKNNYYFFHGTRAENIDGISATGLDPAWGGSGKGAVIYEKKVHDDAKGRIKFGVDPNVAMKYALAPADPEQMGKQPLELGVLLMIRVNKFELWNSWDYRGKGIKGWQMGQKNVSGPNWAVENGGEAFDYAKDNANDGIERFLFNQDLGQVKGAVAQLKKEDQDKDVQAATFPQKNNVRAVETNKAVSKEDIKVVGFGVPATYKMKDEEVQGIMNKFQQEKVKMQLPSPDNPQEIWTTF